MFINRQFVITCAIWALLLTGCGQPGAGTGGAIEPVETSAEGQERASGPADTHDTHDTHDILDIDAHAGQACVVRGDRRVWCWGREWQMNKLLAWEYNGPTVITGLPPARKVFVGQAGVCVVPVAGGLRCAGMGWLENTGADPEAGAPWPDSPKEVVIGQRHACLLYRGDVWCWGSLIQQRMFESVEVKRWWTGDPTARPRVRDPSSTGDEEYEARAPDSVASPLERVVGLPSTIRQLVSTEFEICALDGSGKVWCWGTEGAPARGTAEHDYEFFPYGPSPRLELSANVGLDLSQLGLVIRAGDGASHYSAKGEGWRRDRFGEPVVAVRGWPSRDESAPVYGLTAGGRILVTNGDGPVTQVPGLSDVRRLIGHRDDDDKRRRDLLCALTGDSRVFCWYAKDVPTDDTPYPDDIYHLDAAQHLGWVRFPADAPAGPEPVTPELAAPLPVVPNAPADTVIALDVGDWGRACVVRGDGSAYCWLLGMEHRPHRLAAPPLIDIAVGAADVCGIARTGTVHCFRASDYKENDYRPWTPVREAGVGPAGAIFGLKERFCIRRTSGRVGCFPADRRAAPRGSVTTVAGIAGARDLTLRARGICALVAPTRIDCADERYGLRSFAAPVALRSLVGFSEPERSGLVNPPVLALAEDGQLWRAGFHETELHLAKEARGTDPAWPDVSWRRLVNGPEGVSCGIDRAGRVRCWGQDLRSRGAGLAPVPGLAKATHLAAVDLGRCASAGSQVWCWGDSGPLVGSLRMPPTRVAITGAVVDFDDVQGYYYAAVTRAGALWSWGAIEPENPFYPAVVTHALGVPTRVAVPEPVGRVSITKGSACALSRSGRTVYCWARDESAPVSVQLPVRATDVDVGRSQVCALMRAGQVLCWHPPYIESLDDISPEGPVPRLVQGLSHAKKLAVGPKLGCALDRAGRPHCWSSAAVFKDTADVLDAFVITDIKASALDYGRNDILTFATGSGPLALRAELSVECPPGQRRCAQPSTAQVCDGYDMDDRKHVPDCPRSVPTRPRGHLAVMPSDLEGPLRPSEWSGLAGPPVTVRRGMFLGSWCGVLADGSMYCAGGNQAGRLGAGHGGVRPAPVPVALPRPTVD